MTVGDIKHEKFLTQYRAIPQIGEMYSDLFCNPLPLTNGIGTAVSDRSMAQAFQRFLKAKYNQSDTSILFLDVKNSEIQVAWTSAYNLTNISVVINFIKSLTGADPNQGEPIVEPKNVTIMSPFETSRRNYVDELEKLAETHPHRELGNVSIQVLNVDGYQGNENHIIIYDVITIKTGFTDELHRMTVAMSRARDGLVVVGKTTCADNWKKTEGRSIKKLIKETKTHHFIVQDPAVEAGSGFPRC